MTEPFDIIAELSTRRKALTVLDVAELLSVSKQSVYEYIRRGSLPALQLGNTIRLNPLDVARWLETRQTAPQQLARAA